LHILFNLLVQLRLGADMEKAIGTIRFMIVYFPSGIMGFILGANFAGNGIASTGCSGSLFGIIALVVLVSFPLFLGLMNKNTDVIGFIISLETISPPKTTTCDFIDSSPDLFRLGVIAWVR